MDGSCDGSRMGHLSEFNKWPVRSAGKFGKELSTDKYKTETGREALSRVQHESGAE